MSEITAKFIKSPDFAIKPVTGVWGGPTPAGEIIAEFFVEHRELPEALTFTVSEEDGSISNERRIGGESFVREVIGGISISPATAHVIGTWLISKAAELGFKG